MSIWLTLVTVLLLILPALSQIITTTCEIPSVEAGDNTTLTIHFGEDFIYKQERDFSVTHLDLNDKETPKMLDCLFSYGDVKCHNTTCCKWDSKVTDVFRVYIHNASQQLEGKFWGFVIPANTKYQKYCNFTLKASTCPIDPINVTNSHVTCNKRSITIGESCTVTCNPGHYFQENQTSVTYTCVGRNKWSPEILVTSCEAPTCSRDSINATNSHLTCDDKSLPIGRTCTVICNPDHYFQGNRHFVTCVCVGKNQWFPEIPVISCEEQPKVHTASNFLLLLQLLIVIPIVIFVAILFKKRCQRSNKKKYIEEFVMETRRMHGNQTEPLLPINLSELQEQDNMAVWRRCTRAWYPDYETKTYFVPPVVITRIPFDVVTVAGQSVLVPQCNPVQAIAVQSNSTQVKVQRVQDNDTRDDLALQRVLLSLRELVSEQSEPMFVISHLQFSGYLGEPCYAAAVKQFLRPQNLPKDHRQGDFDILIIHRHYGIISGEIKPVLSNQQQLQLSQPDVDRVVTDRVRNAIKQLNKSEVVLREITKDLDPNLAIRKLLILPYVTDDILTRVVSSDEQLKKDLVTCLQAVDFKQALQCCLLASSSETETANNQQPQTWWSTFNAFKSDSTMTSDLYLDLLARFCGPATTVSVYCPTSPRIEIRTEGQGVAVTGERMTSLVLTPEQISLLIRAPTKVWLTGPPGVGKSVMLVLMALTWLRQGHDVHLVSVWFASLAATRMINHAIHVSMCDDPTTPSAVGSVHLHEYDFFTKETDVDKAINTLTAKRGNHGPYVICDEFTFHYNYTARYHRFVTDLCTRLPNVCMWAASPFHYLRPAELQEERMTIPLRCPPAVLSQIQKSVNRHSDEVHPYTATTLATPCDGPNVIHLSHQGPIHVGRWPLECVKCGQSIAGILQRLGIGVTDSGVNNHINTVTTTATTANTANADKTTLCPPLQYRDVFVLTRSVDLRDDAKDEAGRVISTANGVVRSLRDAGIRVRVIREGHESTDVCDIAVRQSDVVTVTCYGAVSGLERKVVVCLPGRIPGVDDVLTDELIEFNDRLAAMSRCTAQLVVVDVHRV